MQPCALQARGEQEPAAVNLPDSCEDGWASSGLDWHCEDDAAKIVRPVASAGDGLDYLERVKISWGNSGAGEGPVGDAIRTGKSCWVDDIRTDHGRTDAMALGYVSCVALPLAADVGRRVFSICAARLPFMPILSTRAKSNDMPIRHRA
jgi:hypothetical protein